MLLDLSQFSLKAGALSQRPFEILGGPEKKFVSAMMEVLLLEEADRTVRESWQAAQLGNLFKHAAARSAFWKSRLTLLAMDPKHIGRLPSFTRKELIQQVEKEGSLIRPQDALNFREHATSGSSGIPVRFFITEANGSYNAVRYNLESLLNNQLHMNRARFRADFNLPPPGFAIERRSSNDGSKGSMLVKADSYQIKYAHLEPEALLKAIEALDLQIWVSNPGFMEALLSKLDGKDLYRSGLRHWVCMSGRIPDYVRAEVSAAGIKIVRRQII